MKDTEGNFLKIKLDLLLTFMFHLFDDSNILIKLHSSNNNILFISESKYDCVSKSIMYLMKDESAVVSSPFLYEKIRSLLTDEKTFVHFRKKFSFLFKYKKNPILPPYSVLEFQVYKNIPIIPSLIELRREHV